MDDIKAEINTLENLDIYCIYAIYIRSENFYHIQHPNGKIIWITPPIEQTKILKETDRRMIYVGQTMQDPQTRFRDHLWTAGNVNYTRSRRLYDPLSEAIQNSLEIVQVLLEEGLTDDTVDDAEIGWIRELQTFEHGLNSTPGGRFNYFGGHGSNHPNAVAVRWYSKTLGEFECGCIRVLAKFLDASEGSIGYVISGFIKQTWSHRFQDWIQVKRKNDTSAFDPDLPPRYDPIMTPIVTYDIEAKKIDKYFPSIISAADYYGIPTINISGVFSNSKNRQFYALGKRFDVQRIGDDHREWNDPPPYRKSIIAFDQDDNDDDPVVFIIDGASVSRFGTIEDAKKICIHAGCSANHTRLYAGKLNGKQLRWEYEDPIIRSEQTPRTYPLAVHYKIGDCAVSFRTKKDAAEAMCGRFSSKSYASEITDCILTGRICKNGLRWFRGRG